MGCLKLIPCSNLTINGIIKIYSIIIKYFMAIEIFEQQIKEACICHPNDNVFPVTLIAAFAKSAGFVVEQERLPK